MVARQVPLRKQFSDNTLTTHGHHTDTTLTSDWFEISTSDNTLETHWHEIFISDIRLALLPVYRQMTDDTLTTH